MLPCPYCNTPTTRHFISEPALLACPECLNPVFAEAAPNGASTAPLPDYKDIRLQVQRGSVMEGILRTLNKGLDKLPVLPEASRRVLTVIHDPIASTGEVAEVINEDPVLSARVLKLANSALFGSVEPIRELHVASARIGMRGLVQVVQVSAQSDLYTSKEPHFREMIHELWRHSLATAHAAELLAATRSDVSSGEAFFAGLVHDIGKVLLLDFIAGQYTGPKGRLRESPELLQRVIDTFHPLVGLHLTDRWNLPFQYGFTTFYSEAPHRCPVDSWLPLTHLVCLASRIAEVSGYGAPSSDDGDVQAHPSAQRLTVNEETITTISRKLPNAAETLLEAVAA